MENPKLIFSVWELNLASQHLLEEAFGSVWVQGEISNLSCPTSGHIYFSLKDQKAQIRCALFRQRNRMPSQALRNGLLIQVLAKASIYPDRGDFQLIIEQVEMAGDGLLKQAYEALFKKLEQEGLFAAVHKKALPFWPKRIGIISSTTGAALRDILSVLQRRCPSIPLMIYPTLVQGTQAAPEIVRALSFANDQAAVDLIILARGGGSLEDLWPFNEEMVARAIFASQIPVISGIGHETDLTIADWVADRRAPTPSAAAELASPEAAQLLRLLQGHQAALLQQIHNFLSYQTQKVDNLFQQIRHPAQQIQVYLHRLERLDQQLKQGIQQFIERQALCLKHQIQALSMVSPLAILERGYAIVMDRDTHTPIHSIQSIKEAKPIQAVRIRFKDGYLEQSPQGWTVQEEG